MKASHFSRKVRSFKQEFHWLADSLHAHACIQTQNYNGVIVKQTETIKNIFDASEKQALQVFTSSEQAPSQHNLSAASSIKTIMSSSGANCLVPVSLIKTLLFWKTELKGQHITNT